MTENPSRVGQWRRESASPEGLLGKSLPASIEAEKSVLAALLLDDQLITLVADILRPADFYSNQHGTLYQAILELTQANKKIDLLVLQDHLQNKNLLEAAGGIAYLMELQEDIPALGLMAQHARIVKDKAVLRELIHSAAGIITSCYDRSSEQIDTVLDSAEQKIFQISNRLVAPAFVRIDDLLKKTFQQLALVKTTHEGVTGVPTGFVAFDRMTSGMQRGDLLILAARPSMGKTALALNIALSAWQAGGAVGIFSLEMAAEQLVLRMLSAESRIPHQKIRNALVSPDEWITVTNAAGRLAEAKIFIDDSPSLNIMELRAKARKLKAQENVSLIVIDYLQLLHSHQRHENRTQEISAISRALKALAKELDIPVLALSQLSRSLENRMDKRPLLSDLRESGAIEQDGDVIFFIYREAVYNPDTERPDIAEVIVGKQRNGPVGNFNVRFIGEITRFEDLGPGEL
ncbi:MAG: replicative DNA helicase [Candidatus Babeliales bacterium]|jgi:replicative DNA helicase